MGLKRIALVVEYCGTEIAGFQTQHARDPAHPQAKKFPPTVQHELETVLRRLLQEEIVIEGAGRTDAGVHASGQTVVFNSAKERSLNDLIRGCNALLAPWLRVLEAREVPLDFRPRFALHRTYHYYFLTLPGRLGDPFWDRLAWVIPDELNVEAMQQAAAFLVGRHDFRAFSREEPLDKNTVRVMQRLEVRRVSGMSESIGPFARLQGLVCMEVQAHAFLRRMVRQIAGVLYQIGRGRWQPQDAQRILQGGQPQNDALVAPPQGLYLVHVAYPDRPEPARVERRTP